MATATLLANQHVAQQIAASSPLPAQADHADLTMVGQGKMKLYSFYEPSLVGGEYWIDAFQTISVDAPDPETQKRSVQKRSVFNYLSKPTPPTDPENAVRQVQKFEVVAPQFSIPLDDIDTHYPPDGHQDEGRVLPHVVFNDPHLPWERWPGDEDPFRGPSAGNRESVPWLAVIVFDPEELLLDATEISELKIPIMKVISADGAQPLPTKVPPSGAYPMSVQDYLSINKYSRVAYEKDPLFDDELSISQEGMKAIFPKKDLFKELFGTLDLLEQSKSLAHVRNINTTGMPDAGVGETGLFSVIISRRTGPVNLTVPKTQMAHLISIEHFDETIKRDFHPGPSPPIPAEQAKATRIGLVSLFSWTYTALPPNPVNFLDSMIAIGNSTQVLRPDKEILANVKNANLKKRLDSGYVFSRWRAQTGEETVAFNRGPLVPAPVASPGPDSKWPGSSNYGTDYQILDKDLGVMDISYSSAWQLGKTLAIADRVFAAALMRFRGLVYNKAASETRTTVSTMNPAGALFESISSHLDKMVDLSKSSPVTPVRLAPPQNKQIAAGINDSVVQPTFQENLKTETFKQMKAQDLTAGDGAGTAWYNGFNKPVNSDWAVIANWITSKLFLEGIPAQYLIVDPSHLPMERLRFFHIDPNWLDCLIDGALSTCNHADREDDIIRKLIKDGYNKYLQQLQPGGKYTPQTPKFGFILRSAVVKAFPGLHIDIPFPKTVDTKIETRAPISHLTAINDTTLMCLLDRLPEELEKIQLTQPPHQQRFSLGESITPGKDLDPPSVEFELLELVTDKDHIPLGDEGQWDRIPAKPPISSTTVWDPHTRCMNMPELKTLILNNMTKNPQNKSCEFYKDPIVTSLPIALQLNDPCYYLNYKNLTPVYQPQTPRQLWSGPTAGASTTAPTPPTPALPIASPNLPIAIIPSQPTTAPIQTLTPPHIQTGISTTPTLKGTGPAITGTPHIQYTISIFPDYLPYAKASHPDFTIPTHNTYLMDLIFSIKRTNLPSANDTFSLSSIVLDIPLSPANSKDPVPEPLLKYPYAGPGPRMLSNLRFTVSLNRVGNILQCVLVPRGKTAVGMLDRRLMDLSFKLSQCEIAEIVKPQGVSYPRGSGKTGVVRDLGVVSVGWREGYTFAEGARQGVVGSDAPVAVFKDKGGSDVF